MKSHRLARFVTPPPPPRPRCNAPGCEMAPEVVLPLGQGAIDLCWLCAHHHVDHGVPLSECATSEACEHTPDEIYPGRHPVVRLAPTLGQVSDAVEAGFVEIDGRMVQYRFDVAARPAARKGLYEPIDHARSIAVSRGMRAARKFRAK